MILAPPLSDNWYMDIGASSHMVSNYDLQTQLHPSTYFTPSNIIVGNVSSLLVVDTFSGQHTNSLECAMLGGTRCSASYAGQSG